MLTLIRGFSCYVLACVLVLFMLGGLMFAQQFVLIDYWLRSGQPLASLLLNWLPNSFWLALTGLADAATHPAVRSFLQFALALAQFALLPAAGFYRLWYRS